VKEDEVDQEEDEHKIVKTALGLVGNSAAAWRTDIIK